jgi:hypothetical protein
MDAENSIGHQLPMRSFRVKVGPRDAPRLEFDAMATDAVTCAQQHMGLAEGERVAVEAIAHATSRVGEPSTGVA